MLIRFLIALSIIAILLFVYFYSARQAEIKSTRWTNSMNSSKTSWGDRLELAGINVNDSAGLPVEQAIKKIKLADDIRIML